MRRERRLRPMEILPIDPDSPDQATVRRAAGSLARGDLIAFPTETFYGLGADPFSEQAVAALALARPSTGTSANLSGHPPPRTAADVGRALGERADLLPLVLDGGTTAGGAPSTVVDLTSGEPRLVRAGAVPFERVLEALR